MKKNHNIGNTPSISVIMPIFNGEKYLEKAITSILDQTFDDFEFIIIDDGSTDNSIRIIKQFKDSRINFIQNNENLGLIASLNKAISKAQGKYIARMDQDDISKPYRFENQIHFLENNLEYGLIGSWVEVIPNSLSSIHYHTDYNSIRFAMAFYCPFIHPSVMIKRSILNELDVVYDAEYIHAEDYELWTRIIQKTKVCNLNIELLEYRIHETQTSYIHKSHQIQISRKIKEKYIKSILGEHSFVFIDALYSNDKILTTKLNELNELYRLNTIHSFFGGDNLKHKIESKWKSLILESKKISYNECKLINKSQLSKKINFSFKQKIAILKKLI
jgi:glycosyltransferase involved in cell wall biosynthesis